MRPAVMTENDAIAASLGAVPEVDRVYIEPLGDALGVWVVLNPCSMEAQRKVFAAEKQLRGRFHGLSIELTVLDRDERFSDYSESSLSYKKTA